MQIFHTVQRVYFSAQTPKNKMYSLIKLSFNKLPAAAEESLWLQFQPNGVFPSERE